MKKSFEIDDHFLRFSLRISTISDSLPFFFIYSIENHEVIVAKKIGIRLTQ